MEEKKALLQEANGQFEVPSNWAWCELKELLVKASTGPFGSMLHKSDYVDNQVPLVNPMNIVNGRIVPSTRMTVNLSTKERLKPYELSTGNIVIGRRGEMGRCAVVTAVEDGWLCGTGSFFLQLKELISQEYFVLFFSSEHSKKYLDGASVGSTMSNLNHTILNQLPVPLPPLPEQRRIVAKLEELFSRLDAGVASVRRTQVLLKRYRQSVLHAAVTGELTRAWREAHPTQPETGAALLTRIRAERRAQWEAVQVAKRGGQLPLNDAWKSKYEEPAAPDTSELPELPAGWAWAALPELGELNRGKSKHRPRDDKRLYGDAYPFIQTGDVRHANGIIRSHTQSYSEFGLAQSRLWPAGTLCITIAANIADTALLGFDACFPDSVVGFLTEEAHCNIKFIELFLRTAKENIERYAPATAQKNINLEILSKVGIPLPSLEEQAQIVAEAEQRLTVLDVLSQTLTDELKRAERLRQSLLHRAFTGRLVPQDANDEPAAALLARLREGAAAPAKGRKAQASPAPSKEKKPRGRKPIDITQIDFSFLDE